MKRQEAIALVLKLKRLSAHPDTPAHEAATASERAEELMRKHKITESDLEIPESPAAIFQEMSTSGGSTIVPGVPDEQMKELVWFGIRSLFNWMKGRFK